MPLYLGLDCGGSACRAMIVDETGEPVFLAQGGSANLATNSETTLKRSLGRALQGAPAVVATCACFAGLVSDERRRYAEALVQSMVTSDAIHIEPDYAAALRACPEGTSVCVAAGTGSVVCSRTDGVLRKSGASGYLLGDEGSAFQYGRVALREYVRNPNGASDSLRRAVDDVFETTDPKTIIEVLYSANAPAPLLAGLATAFARDAQAGCVYAETTMREQSEALADVVKSHLATYHAGVDSPIIGLAGGLWKRAVFKEAFAEALSVALPGAVVKKSEMPPVRGAALLAMEIK